MYSFSPALEDTPAGQRCYGRDTGIMASSHSGPREHPDKADFFIMYATVESE